MRLVDDRMHRPAQKVEVVALGSSFACDHMRREVLVTEHMQAEGPQNGADRRHAGLVERVMSDVGGAHWMIRRHGVAGMNSLADVAVMSLLRMAVQFAMSSLNGEADPWRRPYGQKRAVVEQVRRCHRVCLHAYGHRLAKSPPRTQAEHAGSCHSSPACETVSAAVCVLA